MKNTVSIFLFLLTILSYSQTNQTVEWINTNSILIEDANPNSELIDFGQNTPDTFANANIYGFGEASHNTKEFFDLKAKFFKHLVKTQGVRVFIMEESYQAESGINEWIGGGKGDIKSIAENFSIGFWHTKEVVDLLQWMRNFNLDKSKEDQIRFYGMDVQNGKNLNTEIRRLITKCNIDIDETLLTRVDSCSNKIINYSKPNDWWQRQIPSLHTLKEQILISKEESKEYQSLLRSVDYLIGYTEYASFVTDEYPKSTEFRDLKMFENVRWIVENLSPDGKAFIWAHNEHINKKEMYYTGSDIMNLGRHLKNHYSEEYYSVGFDFATGKIHGYVVDENQGNHWKTYHIEKPFRRTYAETLNSANKEIYFIDLHDAIEKEPTEFFSTVNKHLLIAGGGYQPKPLHKILISKRYSECYDGLIFVKKITPPDYNISEL